MSLKTDYKDDVFPGNRKYNEVINTDSTKSLVDVTIYTQVGDKFGALDINATNLKVNGIETEMVDVKKSVSDGKILVAGAITAKGQATASDATYAVMASKISAIQTQSILSGNAVASEVLAGKTFYNNNPSSKQTGIMPSKGAATIIPSTVDQTIGANQYLSGDQTIKGDANLKSENVKAGTMIFNTPGKSTVVDTADAVLDPNYLLVGYSGYDDGAKKAGAMINRGAVAITPGTVNQAIEQGYHNGSGYVVGEPNLVSGNIPIGMSMFGVNGGLSLGKKFASGITTPDQTGSSFTGTDGGTVSARTLSVSGLSFTPSRIIARGVSGAFEYYSIYDTLTGSKCIRMFEARLSGSSTTTNYSIDGNIAPVNIYSGGFVMPVLYGNFNYDWIAYE